MKFYLNYFYVFISFVYIAGRFCLVANYEIGQENKRVIRYHVLPQPSANNPTYITGQKITASHVRKFCGRQVCFSPKAVAETVIFNTNLLLPWNSYSGNYIDPPPPGL